MPPGGFAVSTPPRLVASDLDGTLVRSDGTVSDRSLAALKLVEAAGSTLVVVTGRPVRWLTELLPHLGDSGVALVSNGAGVYDLETGRLSRVDTISPVEAAQLTALLSDRVPDATFAAERIDGYVREAGYRTPYSDAGRTQVVDRAELSAEPLLKLLVRSTAHDADSLLAAGREVVGAHLGTLTHSSNAGLLEISAAGVTKASAVERLATGLGINAEGVIAFGDMPNDIPLLRWAGSSFAVANAHPDAREAAKAMTASNDDDGVAVVLEEIFG